MDINCWDIHCGDINCGDITRGNLDCGDIDAWDIDASIILCETLKQREGSTLTAKSLTENRSGYEHHEIKRKRE